MARTFPRRGLMGSLKKSTTVVPNLHLEDEMFVDGSENDTNANEYVEIFTLFI